MLSYRQLKMKKREMTISTIVGVGLCSTRLGWFCGQSRTLPLQPAINEAITKPVMGTKEASHEEKRDHLFLPMTSLDKQLHYKQITKLCW